MGSSRHGALPDANQRWSSAATAAACEGSSAATVYSMY
jgi:hypothetical protein